MFKRKIVFFSGRKIINLYVFTNQVYHNVLGAQINLLVETVLLSTHRNRKIIFEYALLLSTGLTRGCMFVCRHFRFEHNPQFKTR